MKKLFILLPLLQLSTQLSFAETNLSVKAPATKKQLETASQILSEAATLDAANPDRAKKIAKARKLTEDRNVAEKFEAELLCDGTVQFKTADQNDLPAQCCYKGEVAEAKRLVDAAVSQTGLWEWEESKVTKVTVSGETLKIVILDMPNNFDTNILAGKCPNR